MWTDEPVTPRAADGKASRSRRVCVGTAQRFGAGRAGRNCSQAFCFKVGDGIVDQDGKRCRVISVDTADLKNSYELEYPNGVKLWAAESALAADATVRPAAQPECRRKARSLE